MRKLQYGVWHGARYDNRNGGEAFPEDLSIDELSVFNPGNPIDALIGDAGFLVFDDSVSLPGILYRYYSQVRTLSCGRCTPCRTGSLLIEASLKKAASGHARAVDWEDLLQTARQMRETSLCGIGMTTPVPLIGAIEHFRDEFFRSDVAMTGDMYTTATAQCIEACPAHVNIPRYIDYVRDGHPDLALGVLLHHYPMVATCGRVCVRPCEKACRRNAVDAAVSIKDIKRYGVDNAGTTVAELFRNSGIKADPSKTRVAVVGAGPAGLNCAYHLLQKGYPVDIFDKDEKAGGMALRGIPPYRLPKDILKNETDAVAALGANFHYNHRLGTDFTVSSLLENGYGAVFLGIGCAKGALLGLPGENPATRGYRNGIEFLLSVEKGLSQGWPAAIEGDVVIVGCGNVAMDCCRTARRIATGKVHLVYRRTINEAPADREEIEAAMAEGVEFHFLTNPVSIIENNGAVEGVRLTRMELTEKDARGRRGVRAVAGSEFDLPCSTLIAAIGQQVERDVFCEADGVNLDRRGNVQVNEQLFTSRPGVFAGGDCATGPTTLIQGLALGQRAAQSIDDYLSKGSVGFSPRDRMSEIIRKLGLLEDNGPEKPVRQIDRAKVPSIPVAERECNFHEVDLTFDDKTARREASRCMRCYRLYGVVTPRTIPGNSAK